jgi:hypothetical protein
MTTDLPYAAEAEQSLEFDELEVLKTQYSKEVAQGHVSVQTKFNYGECSPPSLQATDSTQRVGADR